MTTLDKPAPQVPRAARPLPDLAADLAADLANVISDVSDALIDNKREGGTDRDCLQYAADLCSSVVRQANDLRDVIIDIERGN